MKRFFGLLFLGCCLFSSKAFTQNTQGNKSWPNSLLWRISGNGLAKNSFLYGTMHVQDKRLFYFSDSLYHYLEQADGYSMEIDIQEMMDSVIQKMLDERETDMIDKKRLARSEDKKKIIDSLLQNVKKYNDKKSKKQLEKFRREKMTKALKNKEMPTIMDAYLYGIAKKKGKWVGGIEDVQDQLSLFDELGADISDKELMAPDAELVTTLEKMIDIYLAKDLNKIEQYIVKQVSAEMEDKMFTKRNIKMARRMDSLANIRSMFFAVGAAHLPGDSGVITLLRRKGYRVEPVFSSKQVDPLVYASNLTDLPWVKIEDARKTYSVEMPGDASDLNMYENFIKMKFFLDITTLNVFMSGSVVTQKDLDFNKLLESVSNNTGAKVSNKKTIEYKGMKGVETIIFTDGYYFKARYLLKDNILYMLMVGGGTKESTDTKDAQKFLQSFVANEVNTAALPKQWSSFEIKEKGIAVMLPGKPSRNAKLEKTVAGNGWVFTVYNYTDEAAGIYYMLQVRDIEPGFYLMSDTGYFSLLRNNMSAAIQKVKKDSIFKWGEYPAFSYEGESEDGRLIFKTLVVNRGNRSYTLYTGGANDPSVYTDMLTFINSLSLPAYEKAAWKNEKMPEANFYTSAPAPIQLKIKDKAENDAKDEISSYYISYNPIDCISYQVYKEAQSPYYWISSDSLFFENVAGSYKSYGDSVWSKREVANGKLKGVEWIIETPGMSNLKKMRQLLNGDTLYTIIAFIPRWSIYDKDQDRFFEEFRAIHEITTTSVFKSKAAKLLTDLQSSDSATFANVSEALGAAHFGKEDKQLLQQALLKRYADDTSGLYYNTRDKIIDQLKDMADSSTVRFMKDNYLTLSGDREIIKFDVLDLLARYKDSYSYSLLKQLLLNHPPTSMGGNGLSLWITDSIQLARTLFPEILQLSNNSLLAGSIINISVEMLDSNLISLDMLMPYRKNFLHTADTVFTALKGKPGDDYYAWHYSGIVQLLRYFNDAESNRLLQQYLTLEDITVKKEAALALLKNKQSVDKKEVEKIAADPEYRKTLYDELVESGNEKLFPFKYLTQKYFAESIIYSNASDDGEPEKIDFIGVRTSIYKGQKKRFYLFKIDFGTNEETGETYQYLGVVGPYSTDIKNLETDNDVTNAFLTYDAKKIDETFAEHLKSLEEEKKEE